MTAAYVTGLLGLLAAVVTATVTVSASVFSGEPVDCIAVVKSYDDYLGDDAQKVLILTQDSPDGVSPLEADERATACGITRQTLKDMTLTP